MQIENSPAFHNDTRLLSRSRISIQPLIGGPDIFYKLLQVMKQLVNVSMGFWKFIRLQSYH